MPLWLVREDVTRMDVDAIVNAANTALTQGGGVCGAIFQAAGARQMREACAPLSPIRVGEAVITPGFLLKARYVIHAAGPVWRGGKSGEEALLGACYLRSLELAVKYRLASVAFPLISIYPASICRGTAPFPCRRRGWSPRSRTRMRRVTRRPPWAARTRRRGTAGGTESPDRAMPPGTARSAALCACRARPPTSPPRQTPRQSRFSNNLNDPRCSR